MRKENRIQGYFDWRLINADGSVAREGGGKNLVVDHGRNHFYTDNNAPYPAGRYIFIADDAPGGTPRDIVPNLNILASAVGTDANFTGVRIDSGTGGWDRPSLTRTTVVTFLAPSVQRQVTHVGMKFNSDWSGSTNAPTHGTHGNIFSALKIDPPIIQEITQTLEITYRVVVLPITDKGFTRFPAAGRDVNRLFLEQVLVDHVSNVNEPRSWLMPYTFGSRHFIDEGALALHTYRNNVHYRNQFNSIVNLSPANHLKYKSGNVTRLAASDDFWNGAWGMLCSGADDEGLVRDETTLNGLARHAAQGYYPLAHDWGKVGPLVFAHPIGRSHLFNEVAIDKTGQGDLEIQGPYIPNDAGDAGPQHWCYHVVVTDSGDADPGTEGAYIFSHMMWVSYPFNMQARARSATGSYTYIADDGGSGNSAITQASGDFRATDFFQPDSRLEVSGTVSNDATTYKIRAVEPLKLTLEGVVLTGEGPVASTLDANDLFSHSGNGDRLVSGSTGAQGWQAKVNRLERHDSVEGTNTTRYNLYRQVWDGVDSYWGLGWRNSGHAGSWFYTGYRWRAMTGEHEFRGFPNGLSPSLGAGDSGNPFTDTTRFVRHTDGSPIGMASVDQPYALASDYAGLVFFGERDVAEGAANNSVFIIDNSKSGRWYQRPSGAVDGAGVFTVDAGDEIHAMFPFVSGDAGAAPRIRIVNSTQGNDGVYPVATFNNANEVVLTGAFTAESNLEWHWTTVDNTQPAVGDLLGLVYDRVNSRLWALGSLGLKHSDDNGQTWSTLLDESTAVTPLIDSESRAGIRVANVDNGHGGYDIDPNGDLYWLSIDSGGSGEDWLNKLELNSGIGVDAVHSRIGLGADFPGANKPSLLALLVWEKGVDNSNQLGALWVMPTGLDTETSWYRMTIDAGAISAAPQIAKILEHNPQTINNIPASYDTATQLITTQGGLTYLRERSTGISWLQFDPRYANDPDNAYQDWGGSIFSNTQGFLGTIGQEAWRPDGCFYVTTGESEHGYFGSLQQYFRFAPAADVGGQSGAAASIVAGAPAGQVRVQGLTGMTADSVGRHLEITGAASGGNNATFIIAAQNSATEVDVFSPNGVTGDANNGAINWQEKESEWVPWEGTEAVFNAWYGTVSGGRRPMHAGHEELRDNVQVRFTELGGATAPEDEFVEGECFTFIASFGEHKTNVEDMTISGFQSFGPMSVHLEEEAIKVATGPGSLAAFHDDTTALSVPSAIVMEPGFRLDANGRNWGWEPYKTYGLYGQGLHPDSGPSSGIRPSFRTGLDLGAGPPEIHKLVLVVNHGDNDFGNDGSRFAYGPADVQRYIDMAIYTAADLVSVPTEVDGNLRWPAGSLANFIQIQQNVAFWVFENYDNYMITIDLAGAGLTVGQRTARFWEVVTAFHGSGSTANVNLAGIWALDASDNVIGMGVNHSVDEAQNVDFHAVNIQEAFWIQNVHGGGDPGAGTVISTTDDGDGDGYTDRVTLDGGLFDTANIDITKDFLAWNEPGNPSTNGYLRATNRAGQPAPRSSSNFTAVDTQARSPQLPQAMSRIIDIGTPGQIIVEDDMIPDNLSGVEWEVRRPASPQIGTSTSVDADVFFYCPRTGFFRHQPANISASRRFRVARKHVWTK